MGALHIQVQGAAAPVGIYTYYTRHPTLMVVVMVALVLHRVVEEVEQEVINIDKYPVKLHLNGIGTVVMVVLVVVGDLLEMQATPLAVCTQIREARIIGGDGLHSVVQVVVLVAKQLIQMDMACISIMVETTDHKFKEQYRDKQQLD